MFTLIKAPYRGVDAFGSGEYGASRGNRTHNGIDVACLAGSIVLSKSDGVVTKLGYPYNPNDKKKGHYRYVEVTDNNGMSARYFYISPTVELGQRVKAGDELGETQTLQKVYPGITDHFHFEVVTHQGNAKIYHDPRLYP